MNMLALRQKFPQLQETVNGQRLVYLDSAATTLKPQVVIDRLTQYYSSEVSNVHRGAHYFSNQATENYENARKKWAAYLEAQAEEIIFTSGTTDGLNLLSYAFDKLILAYQKDPSKKNKREILLTEEEHHSNIVPWYWLAKRHGLTIRTIPFDASGELNLQNLSALLNDNTFMVSVAHMSNTLGTLNDVRQICQAAKAVGAVSVVDAAQSISYAPVSVKDIGCDFLVFSSHKVFGPEGVGLLFGKREMLANIGYFKGGGSMISTVNFDKIEFLSAPQKFEAGTPPIGPVIAFGTALDFFSAIDKEKLQSHERSLVQTTHEMLLDIPGYQPLGDVSIKQNILSFNIDQCHPADLGSLVDEMGVAVRVGHHCTQPLLRKAGLTATVRASFSIYNSGKDCEALVIALKKAREMLI